MFNWTSNQCNLMSHHSCRPIRQNYIFSFVCIIYKDGKHWIYSTLFSLLLCSINFAPEPFILFSVQVISVKDWESWQFQLKLGEGKLDWNVTERKFHFNFDLVPLKCKIYSHANVWEQLSFLYCLSALFSSDTLVNFSFQLILTLDQIQ